MRPAQSQKASEEKQGQEERREYSISRMESSLSKEKNEDANRTRMFLGL